MNKAIGFIGLGVMGFPMAGHLSKKYQVSVFNRLGSGPLSKEDMHKLYLTEEGKPWFVVDEPNESKIMQAKIYD